MARKTKIKEIEPFQRGLTIVFKVIKKKYVRKTRKDGNYVCECLIADDTGSILLTLWNENVIMVEEGEYFILYDGYAKIHRSKLKVNIRRYGDIEPYLDQGYDINTKNNLSKKKYDQSLTLLQSKEVSSDIINNDLNIQQDNVRVIGMDI